MDNTENFQSIVPIQSIGDHPISHEVGLLLLVDGDEVRGMVDIHLERGAGAIYN